MTRICRIGAYLFFLSMVLPAGPVEGSEARITGVRYWSAPDQTRIIFDVTNEFSYNYFSLPDPQRFVIDFKHTFPGFKPQAISVDDAVVKQIRFGQFSGDVFRVVCDLQAPVEATVFSPKQVQGKADRLVLELFRPDLRAQGERERQQRSQECENRKIIVIDPGHGGEDPGAVGPGGTKEKNIVLAVARSLKDDFNQRNDCQAFLTRDGDYFLSLRERTRIAEDYRADLFLSIHTDSNRDRRLTGSSVYCLSVQGASDEASRCLAEDENAADLVGGIPFTENDDLNFMLLDLALTDTINSSLHFGSMLLKQMAKVHTVKFEQPKQAGFVVLKTPDIPSVLVELGFLSNPKEEKVLRQDHFHLTMAEAIVAASDDFLSLMDRKNGVHARPSPAKADPEGQLSLLHTSPAK